MQNSHCGGLGSVTEQSTLDLWLIVVCGRGFLPSTSFSLYSTLFLQCTIVITPEVYDRTKQPAFYHNLRSQLRLPLLLELFGLRGVKKLIQPETVFLQVLGLLVN
jgi:hypothetical protein